MTGLCIDSRDQIQDFCSFGTRRTVEEKGKGRDLLTMIDVNTRGKSFKFFEDMMSADDLQKSFSFQRVIPYSRLPFESRIMLAISLLTGICYLVSRYRSLPNTELRYKTGSLLCLLTYLYVQYFTTYVLLTTVVVILTANKLI
jgi:hypothetical protein